MNILVRNLIGKITNEKLSELFAGFGKVSSAVVITDIATGRSRGFGFVEMPDAVEGQSAVSALHHSFFEGKKLRVKEANPLYNADYYLTGKDVKDAAAREVKNPAGPGERLKPEFESREPRSFDVAKLSSENRGYPRNDRKRTDYKPRGERSYGNRSSYPPREGARPEYKPRSEKSFGNRSFGGRDSRPSYSSREGIGQEYKPRGERNFDSSSYGRRDSRPSYPRNDGFRSEYRQRSEKSYGNNSYGEKSSSPRFKNYSSPRPAGSYGRMSTSGPEYRSGYNPRSGSGRSYGYDNRRGSSNKPSSWQGKPGFKSGAGANGTQRGGENKRSFSGPRQTGHSAPRKNFSGYRPRNPGSRGRA